MVMNEAHDGYLEIYLNLGLVGLLFVGGFLIAAYRINSRRFRASSSIGSLGLALWTVLLFYNVTESALFNSHPIWVVFLLGVLVVPVRRKQPVRTLAQRATFPNTHAIDKHRRGGVLSQRNARLMFLK
jgi:O-antigen ligase